MGNWISYLEPGCSNCDYGSFNSNITSYSVGAVTDQSVTIQTGNQTQDVEVTFAVNGNPVGVASTAASGQQSGIYYTSDPISLSPGPNTITITADDPLHRLPAMVYTLSMPSAQISNTSPPLVQGTVAVGNDLGCTAGSWAVYPLPTTINPTWQESTDGANWTQVAFGEGDPWPSSANDNVISIRIAPADAGHYFRCTVTASNTAGTVTAYSAAVQVPAPPTTTTTTATTTTSTTTTTPGSSASSPPGSGSSGLPGSSSASSDSSGASASSTASPSSSPSATPSSVSVSSPVVTTKNGKAAVSFSVHLSASSSLQVTLVEPSGKAVLQFGTRAAKGSTLITKNVPSFDLRKGSHLTLRIALTSHGKTHTTSIPLKV